MKEVIEPQTVFLSEIEDLMEKGLTLVEAVTYWCENRGLEIEYGASLIKKNKALKELLKEEAKGLNLLKEE